MPNTWKSMVAQNQLLTLVEYLISQCHIR